MATIDLGKIKIVWRGTYAGGTAYTPDDAVVQSGTSYICIANTTGNAPPNGTYWNVLAQAGTNGTDVGTTLTTQGDILYRDGSGLQRLAAGTNGQVLKTGGSGANPSWTNQAEGGLIHILTQTITSGVPATVDFIHGTNGVVFDGTYKHYVMMVSDFVPNSNNNVAGVRFRQGGSFRSSNYDYAATAWEQNTGRNDSTGSSQSYGRLFARNLGNESQDNFSFKIDIPNPAGSRQKAVYMIGGGRGGNNTAGIMTGAAINTTDNAAMDGIQIIMGGGNIRSGIFSLYGMKSS